MGNLRERLYVFWRDKRNHWKYFFSPVKKKLSYEDFLYYRMQDMGAAAQREIMTVAELEEAEKKWNRDEYREIFNSKKKFYGRFRKFMHREVLFLEDTGEAQFRAFLERHPKAILKPDDMYAGYGVVLVEDGAMTDVSGFSGVASKTGAVLAMDGIEPHGMSPITDVMSAENRLMPDGADLRDGNKAAPDLRAADGSSQAERGNVSKPQDADRSPLREKELFYKNFLPEKIGKAQALQNYERLRQSRYIAEEYVRQEESYARIYPEALNTVRLNTFVGRDGRAFVFAAANQFGSEGGITDNNDDNGIWGNIEISSGRVDAVEINDDNNYINTIHPDTKEEILGFVNPAFGRMKELAEELAAVVPQCRLVGWDICLTDDDRLELIEGNVTPELDLYQAMTGRGLRSFFQSLE